MEHLIAKTVIDQQIRDLITPPVEKLGFEVAVLPAAGDIEKKASAIQVSRVKHLKHLADTLSPCD